MQHYLNLDTATDARFDMSMSAAVDGVGNSEYSIAEDAQFGFANCAAPSTEMLYRLETAFHPGPADGLHPASTADDVAMHLRELHVLCNRFGLDFAKRCTREMWRATEDIGVPYEIWNAGVILFDAQENAT